MEVSRWDSLGPCWNQLVTAMRFSFSVGLRGMLPWGTCLSDGGIPQWIFARTTLSCFEDVARAIMSVSIRGDQYHVELIHSVEEDSLRSERIEA